MARRTAPPPRSARRACPARPRSGPAGRRPPRRPGGGRARCPGARSGLAWLLPVRGAGVALQPRAQAGGAAGGQARAHGLRQQPVPGLGDGGLAQFVGPCSGLVQGLVPVFGGHRVLRWVGTVCTLLRVPWLGNRRNSKSVLQKMQNQPMNLHLDDLALFVRVAELGTLSAAARERDAPVSQVTRCLARLEAACGARLMHRSTHGLSLTDEGDMVLAHARQMLQTGQQLQAELGGRQGGPRGCVRVGASAVIAQAVIAPSLPALQRRHPGLCLDIVADDRLVDMVREGLDVAIRTGTPTDSDLVARPIGQLSRSLYASPAYARAHGLPAQPAELAAHALVGHSLLPHLNQWAPASPQAMPWAVDPVARPLVREGRLLPVLPEHFGEQPLPMHAVMLRERHRLPKVRACIEHWAEWMA